MIDTAIDELHNETEALMWSFSNYSWLSFPFSTYWAWLFGQMYSDLNFQTSSEHHHVVHSSMHNSLWIFDGLHLPLQNRWNADIGNAYYSGWKGQFLASQVVVECDPRPMHQDGGKAEWVLKTFTRDFLIYLEITSDCSLAFPQLRVLGEEDVWLELSVEEYREAVHSKMWKDFWMPIFVVWGKLWSGEMEPWTQ